MDLFDRNIFDPNIFDVGIEQRKGSISGGGGGGKLYRRLPIKKKPSDIPEIKKELIIKDVEIEIISMSLELKTQLPEIYKESNIEIILTGKKVFYLKNGLPQVETTKDYYDENEIIKLIITLGDVSWNYRN